MNILLTPSGAQIAKQVAYFVSGVGPCILLARIHLTAGFISPNPRGVQLLVDVLEMYNKGSLRNV